MPERPFVTVGAIIMNQRNEVLLFKSDKWHGKYILPSGHVEYSETLENAVKREVKEETNLEIYDINFLKPIELVNSQEYHKTDKHFICMQYVCKTSGLDVKINSEGKEPVWMTLGEAFKQDLESVTRETIQYYTFYYL